MKLYWLIQVTLCFSLLSCDYNKKEKEKELYDQVINEGATTLCGCTAGIEDIDSATPEEFFIMHDCVLQYVEKDGAFESRKKLVYELMEQQCPSGLVSLKKLLGDEE